MLKEFTFAFTGLSFVSFEYILNHILKDNCWKGTQVSVTSLCLWVSAAYMFELLSWDTSLYVYSNPVILNLPFSKYFCRIIIHLGYIWSHLGRFCKSCCPGPTLLPRRPNRQPGSRTTAGCYSPLDAICVIGSLPVPRTTIPPIPTLKTWEVCISKTLIKVFFSPFFLANSFASQLLKNRR